MQALNTLFDQFLKERVYLHNVTPKTAEWYRNVWLVFSRWRDAQPLRAASTRHYGSDPHALSYLQKRLDDAGIAASVRRVNRTSADRASD